MSQVRGTGGKREGKMSESFAFVVREETRQCPTLVTPISTARTYSNREKSHGYLLPTEMTISRRERFTTEDIANRKNRIKEQKQVKDLDEIGFKYSTFRRVFVRHVSDKAVDELQHKKRVQRVEELHRLLPGTEQRNKGSVIYRGQERILSRYYKELHDQTKK